MFLFDSYLTPLTGADLVIAGRVADPSLFVAPIAYSFGWDLSKDFHLIAQATMAGHLLGTNLSYFFFIFSSPPPFFLVFF